MKTTIPVFSVFCFIVIFSFAFNLASAQYVQCVKLPRDLSQGANDTSFGGEVTKLQNFLKQTGFMKVSPNGNFGPSTLAAVKAYQLSKNISATGTAGPLTRFAIEYQSCSSAVVQNPPSEQTTQPIQVSSQNVVNRPLAEDSLMLGSKYTIKWSGGNVSDLALVLEDNEGVTKGFISSYISGNNYEWNVGEVWVSGSGSAKRVEAGKYRIRMQSRSFGRTSSDPVGPLFNISTPELRISSISPSSIIADGSSSVALIGAGLNGASVYLGDWYSNPVSVLYVSPDGRIAVIAVPPSVPSGRHKIVVRNVYGSLLTTELTLTVTR